jgi:hypothetical protein
MAVEFVVEDGTGLSTATSYVSVDDFKQYWENRGVDYSGYDEDAIKGKLNLATQYIDGLYNYQGYKWTDEQALEFPRDYIVDRNNIEWSGEIPVNLVKATCEASGYSFSKSLFVNMENVSSKSIGNVRVTYKGQQQPVKISAIGKLIGDYSRQLRVFR